MYWYNPATQKVSTPAPVQYPVLRQNGLTNSASPKPVLSQAAKPCAVMPVRMASQRMVPGTNTPYPPVDPGFIAKCKKFQAPNGLPVHLKGGVADAALLRLTWGMIFVGVIWGYVELAPKFFKA